MPIDIKELWNSLPEKQPESVFPDFFNIKNCSDLSRVLRLVTIKNFLLQGGIDEKSARELLSGPLDPGDKSTFFDDSEWFDFKLPD